MGTAASFMSSSVKSVAAPIKVTLSRWWLNFEPMASITGRELVVLTGLQRLGIAPTTFIVIAHSAARLGRLLFLCLLCRGT